MFRYVILAGALTLCASMNAMAQFPDKPVRFMVPYSPGGALDAMLRLVAEQMSASMGQPVLLEHKPGGATTIAASATLQAPADGHSIFVNAISYVTNPLLMSKYPYDPARDFLPVTLATSNPHVLVAHPGLGTKAFAEFVAMARTRGHTMSYASIGPGSSSHLGFELFKRGYGFDMVHIPYKGVPQSVLDVAGGQVQAMLMDQPVVAGQVRGGKLTGLAIAAEKRSALLPDVPTFQEASGKPFLSRSWFGMMVRSGTPPETVRILHREISTALNKPAIRDRLASVGTDVIASTPEEFAAFLKSESEKFGEAIRISGTKLE